MLRIILYYHINSKSNCVHSSSSCHTNKQILIIDQSNIVFLRSVFITNSQRTNEIFISIFIWHCFSPQTPTCHCSVQISLSVRPIKFKSINSLKYEMLLFVVRYCSVKHINEPILFIIKCWK